MHDADSGGTSASPGFAPGDEACRIEVSVAGETAFVRFDGELDLQVVDRCGGAIADAERCVGGLVIIDLERLGFIDCCGLTMLCAAADRLEGRLRVIGASAQVRRLFALTGAAERLPLVPGAAMRPT